MKRLKSFIIVLAILSLSTTLLAGEFGRDAETFENIKRIKILTISACCIVKPSEDDNVMVRVKGDYEPKSNVSFEYDVHRSTLELSEIIRDYSSGNAYFYIYVPDDIKISFISASGGFELKGVNGTFKTALASGGIEIDNSTGIFDINTASGIIEAKNVIIEGESNFGTASGSAYVKLDATPEHDIKVGSASGKAVLDFNDHAIKGYIEMSYKERGGKIKAPFDFDDKERWRHEDSSDWYVSETVVFGDKDYPIIEVGTSSGKAELKN